MKLDLGIMAGPESKKFLVDLTKLVDRMEALLKGKKTKAKDEDESDDEEETDEEETDKTTEDSDEEETDEESDDAEESEESDDEEEEEKPAPKKGKKVTAEHLNDACKALHARLIKKKKLTSKKAFAQIKALLNKNFETESTSQIDAADRAKALALLNCHTK